ncbi:hypothetical protein PHYBLDRAFT_65625 [Phycomyces blakesleeanus NRRL 1555(-)]|uniref:Uncharacterized protein n=1 Tax=Phycomyces blakesleeanus (strain ATCC 8743b / DSM 1359 / FGSC 10004 / NBRC 33097 / NRRL 1555) TaxID=763407 RepID=A0A162PRV7_PHYB8|nr:hypothetical protein PHYBLDRAFT_65625 [Phycomyces blakesleeanus NRRL 1555(-)]OAD72326.1 hypothetical protein PHYBLDRAFT_65625 [Phycomyces blakesleeanus NRRL 1555(-)]|eukprot:XP_018290366.1 hypothetical protein PHYBLDRAFT_65625 [Phycomyces blakesleeanus NRRL 1555(-)]
MSILKNDEVCSGTSEPTMNKVNILLGQHSCAGKVQEQKKTILDASYGPTTSFELSYRLGKKQQYFLRFTPNSIEVKVTVLSEKPMSNVRTAQNGYELVAVNSKNQEWFIHSTNDTGTGTGYYYQCLFTDYIIYLSIPRRENRKMYRLSVLEEYYSTQNYYNLTVNCLHIPGLYNIRIYHLSRKAKLLNRTVLTPTVEVAPLGITEKSTRLSENTSTGDIQLVNSVFLTNVNSTNGRKFYKSSKKPTMVLSNMNIVGQHLKKPWSRKTAGHKPDCAIVLAITIRNVRLTGKSFKLYILLSFTLKTINEATPFRALTVEASIKATGWNPDFLRPLRVLFTKVHTIVTHTALNNSIFLTELPRDPFFDLDEYITISIFWFFYASTKSRTSHQYLFRKFHLSSYINHSKASKCLARKISAEFGWPSVLMKTSKRSSSGGLLCETKTDRNSKNIEIFPPVYRLRFTQDTVEHGSEGQYHISCFSFGNCPIEYKATFDFIGLNEIKTNIQTDLNLKKISKTLATLLLKTPKGLLMLNFKKFHTSTP